MGSRSVCSSPCGTIIKPIPVKATAQAARTLVGRRAVITGKRSAFSLPPALLVRELELLAVVKDSDPPHKKR